MSVLAVGDDELYVGDDELTHTKSRRSEVAEDDTDNDTRSGGTSVQCP